MMDTQDLSPDYCKESRVSEKVAWVPCAMCKVCAPHTKHTTANGHVVSGFGYITPEPICRSLLQWVAPGNRHRWLWVGCGNRRIPNSVKNDAGRTYVPSLLALQPVRRKIWRQSRFCLSLTLSRAQVFFLSPQFRPFALGNQCEWMRDLLGTSEL
jgi:hypothetical protein